LGTVFYELQSGLNPFSANSGDEIEDNIASGYVDLSWYVENDAQMELLLSRMFEVDWANRITIDDVVNHPALE
jgi:serine/threonine protein kinase